MARDKLIDTLIDTSKNKNIFMPSNPIRRLYSKILSQVSPQIPSQVLSFKGYALPSSAWKISRKGVASLFLLIILLLLITVTMAAPEITTDKNEYHLGERVMISINNATNDSVLKIIEGDNIYRFIGRLNHSMEFRPYNTGEHTVSLEYDMYNEVTTSFMVNPEPGFDPQKNIIQRVYEPSVVETVEEKKPLLTDLTDLSLQESRGVSISKDWMIIRNHEQEVLEKELNLYDTKANRVYGTVANATHNPVGPYDTEIILENQSIKRILFRNLETKGNSNVELRIDELTGNIEKAGETSKQFYVIDPTSLNFTNASVTVTAKGNSLMKCKDWNYTLQECYGNWEKVRDITPGENYTFLLTPEDPAFNETTHNADDCFNEAAGANCTGAEVTAISADSGTTYPFHKLAGSPVRVSFSNEASLIDSILNCTVYVDGFDSDSNNWTLQLGNWSTSIWDDAGAGQTAPSPEGNISWNCLPHFDNNNDDESLFDDFAIRISTADRGRTANAYIDHVFVVINFTMQDTDAPYYSNIVADPSSPATFSPSGSYQFNTTWQDNEAVDEAWIEHNFTGSMTNDTAVPNVSSVYYYNYGSNIAAGSYVWKMHANDTTGNQNSSMPWQIYIVNKSSSEVNLLLNGTDGNFTFNNSGSVNITGFLVTGESNITIYEQGVQIAYGPSPQTTIRTYTSSGVYNITLVYQATQNYTSSQETHFVIVQDTIPPGPVTNLNETKTGETWILWNWSNPIGDSDFDHVEIWLNGSPIDNTSNEYYNVSGLLADTGYEIQVRSVDNWTTPNKGYFENDTARTNTSADVTPPGLYDIHNTSITDQSAIIIWNSTELATGIVKYGTSPGSYIYNVTNLTFAIKHVIRLASLSSGTIYYYVVNSSDAAGNSNQSMEYNFTTLGDQSPPIYFNISAKPPSPTTFSPTGSYQFNTTWQDNEQVDEVWIEHNFTGSMTNDTAVPNVSSVYYYNYGSNIAAGSYVWKMHANDTIGNQNSSMPWQTYTIYKANSIIELLLNGTPGNISINESFGVNITGTLVTGQGNITIYENGSQIAYGPSPQTTIRTYNSPGTRNITLVYAGNQNYSENQTTHFVIVNDTRAPWVFLVDPENGSSDPDGDVIFTFNVNDTGPVDNCSLYINGGFNQTKDILTKGDNTFILNDQVNDNYTWYVNCSDYANNTNVSVTWNYTVEINEFYPTITPVSCVEELGACNVSRINNTPDVWEEHGALQKNPDRNNYVNITFQSTNIRLGSTIHWMYIFYDKYQETLDGFLELQWLNGSTWVEICQIAFANSTTHAHDYVLCNFSNTSRPSIDQINNGLNISANFYYSGGPVSYQYGTDEVYINLKYTEDVTPPTVELIGPSTYHRPGRVNFTYIPSDAHLANCTLYGDFNGTWMSNKTDTAVQSAQTENFTINLSLGFYTWNVYCCDVAENCAFDKIGGPYNDGNYTVNITNPDLVVSQIDFGVNDKQTKEGMNITINATILNQGNVNVTETFNVSFFIGDPDSGGTQINGNRTIIGLNVGQTKIVNVTWIIDRGGPRNIYVIVDPPLATNGSVDEIIEDNNKNNNTLQVPGYSYLYGHVENNIYLANSDNESIYYYLDLANVTGNILALDEGSTIGFGALQAIGRDVDNNSVSNDFNDTDQALNMSKYNDSIRWVYTRNTDTPIATKSMTIFDRLINNIPVVNSTNTSSFQTGILWDMSDGGGQYDGTQDILFITEINQDKTGAYGTYDYEIRIPTNLRDYVAAGNNVDLYWELVETVV